MPKCHSQSCRGKMKTQFSVTATLLHFTAKLHYLLEDKNLILFPIIVEFNHNAAFPAWLVWFREVLRNFHGDNGPCGDCPTSNGLPTPTHEAPQRSCYVAYLQPPWSKGFRKLSPKSTGNPSSQSFFRNSALAELRVRNGDKDRSIWEISMFIKIGTTILSKLGLICSYFGN